MTFKIPLIFLISYKMITKLQICFKYIFCFKDILLSHFIYFIESKIVFFFSNYSIFFLSYSHKIKIRFNRNWMLKYCYISVYTILYYDVHIMAQSTALISICSQRVCQFKKIIITRVSKCDYYHLITLYFIHKINYEIKIYRELKNIITSMFPTTTVF